MRFLWKRWRLTLVAALTAITVSVPFAGTALAQNSQPGEWGTYHTEHVGGQPLYSSDTVDEARTTVGTLLQAWKANDNSGSVWFSLGAGDPFRLGSTSTGAAPTVTPWEGDAFMAFYVGVDNNIYYTHIWPGGTGPGGVNWDGWQAIPSQTSSLFAPVAVVQLGAGSKWLEVIYRSSSNCCSQYRDAIWATVTDGYTFYAPFVIGASPLGVSATYNPVTNSVWVAATGTDNDLWITNNGLSANPNWVPQYVWSRERPAIAAAADGNMMVGYFTSNNNTPIYRAYNSSGQPIDDWTQDITGWETPVPISFSVIGSTIWTLFTGNNHEVYYKQAYSS